MRVAQPPDLLGGDHDEDRLVAGEAVEHERDRLGQEALAARVEAGLVAELGEGGHARRRQRAARAAIRARTSGRRSGGTVAGGCLRGGSVASRRVVVAVTSSTAAAKAAAPSGSAGGFWSPLTLRTYWSEAAAISSVVAGGCSPRSSVMFRHMASTVRP